MQNNKRFEPESLFVMKILFDSLMVFSRLLTYLVVSALLNHILADTDPVSVIQTVLLRSGGQALQW
jgi:hypothetical protein